MHVLGARKWIGGVNAASPIPKRLDAEHPEEKRRVCWLSKGTLWGERRGKPKLALEGVIKDAKWAYPRLSSVGQELRRGCPRVALGHVDILKCCKRNACMGFEGGPVNIP
ncbi:predicted protein [Pyrenophora tritici-repentis Pt-1C-BFP]|uniref:Uncharacterized protein n=1 Tax=Pyrenophora tritici-repentis (strain Pt-1C-BFP) TaxID=426418 RepID=B2WKD2_PYRTR|nr:uncharacterized protein PTRG_10442 [Pyrenophora tritici-repentis Pt-1C-BFP]EDU43492.1 predicted protein [Pyrenophora tritici-repentis Pt-1C-BFP]